MTGAPFLYMDSSVLGVIEKQDATHLYFSKSLKPSMNLASNVLDPTAVSAIEGLTDEGDDGPDEGPLTGSAFAVGFKSASVIVKGMGSLLSWASPLRVGGDDGEALESTLSGDLSLRRFFSVSLSTACRT